MAKYDSGASSGLAPIYYADFLRENLYANLFFRQFGTEISIPRGYTGKIYIPRWQTPIETSGGTAALVATLTATGILTEGTPQVSSTTLGVASLTGTLTGWGGARRYTDDLILMSYIDWTEAAVESLARELAFRFDDYTRKKISASYLTMPAGVSKVQTSGYLRGKVLAGLPPKLDARAVPRWSDGTFVLVTHPFAAYDIYSDISATGWVSVKRYHDPSEIYKGEIGQMYGVRIVLTSAMQKKIGVKTNSGDTVPSAYLGMCATVSGWNALLLGDNPYYTLQYEGAGLEIIHHPLGSSGSRQDPINQIGSIGVKTKFGVCKHLLADYKVTRVPHTSTIYS